MEVVARVEKSEQGCINGGGKPNSESAALKEVADPVVYKLVRVDLDGKFVPATDDELMEVENLFELENNDTVSTSDVSETDRQDLDEDDTKTSQYKGPSQIKDEESDEDSVKPHLKDALCGSVNSRLEGIPHNMGELGLEDESNTSGSASSGPNFSLLKGEINLDRLTVRGLQETFRATFGRKTSVKDKMWLKRRIAMGLTNSCDVAETSFVINNGKFIDKPKDVCNDMACERSIAEDDVSSNSDSHHDPRKDMVDELTFSDSGCRSDNSLEHRAAKRVRKPTKRYIEELSDKETNDPSGKPISPSKRLEQDKTCLSPAIKTAWSVNTGAFVTRRDSIGGSGVQVPYVSRVRRCRPRQSIMTLSKFESSDMALTSKIVESSDAPNPPQLCASSKAKPVEIKYVPSEDPIASEDSAEKQSTTSLSDNSHDRKPKSMESEGNALTDNATGNNSGTNSDDNIATVLTAKGGIRRKHHRAWTLTEVVKLVDGVSKFGPGRWSEIKRLSFSSYSHRTAVDLKDKWRNLLKASSFLNVPTEKGMNIRMKAPMPIPAPILVKVRELAEMNGQSADAQSKKG